MISKSNLSLPLANNILKLFVKKPSFIDIKNSKKNISSS